MDPVLGSIAIAALGVLGVWLRARGISPKVLRAVGELRAEVETALQETATLRAEQTTVRGTLDLHRSRLEEYGVRQMAEARRIDALEFHWEQLLDLLKMSEARATREKLEVLSAFEKHEEREVEMASLAEKRQVDRTKELKDDVAKQIDSVRTDVNGLGKRIDAMLAAKQGGNHGSE